MRQEGNKLIGTPIEIVRHEASKEKNKGSNRMALDFGNGTVEEFFVNTSTLERMLAFLDGVGGRWVNNNEEE